MEISGAIRQAASPPEAAQLSRPAEPSSKRAEADAPSLVEADAGSAAVSREVVAALAAEAASNTRNGSKIRVDESTDRIVVQILNAENEVIRQLPPEALLKAMRNFREVVGLVFDQQT